MLRFICCILLSIWANVALAAAPTLALYYGVQPPWDELQAFDLVVVDPDHVTQPTQVQLPHTRLVAYVALGEVQPSRPYASRIPGDWLAGDNRDWGSRLIDQSQARWPQFFAEQVIAPLWRQGYRTFFLDTLDSYQRFAKTDEQRAAQEAGMVAAIDALKQRFPDVRLILNRGFEILPRIHHYVEMVVAESLFRGYDAAKKTYVEVPEADRAWLLKQLQRARDDYHLQVAAIDYVAPSQRDLARQTASQISALGLIPWVATPDLASLGVGAIEVMPRKVLVVHSVLADEYALRLLDPLRLASMPMNYLGYVPEFVDIAHLPDINLVGRFAGVLLWLTDDGKSTARQRLNDWLVQQVAAGVPVAMVNPPDEMFSGSLGAALGTQIGEFVNSAVPITIFQQSSLMGFETPPNVEPSGLTPLAVTGAKPLLTLQQDQRTRVAAAITPWGGYVGPGFAVVDLPGFVDMRWVINPYEFFRQALRLPTIPVPDTTTESGRRLLMVHMDGDGFISRSELPGNPLAGQAVLERVVKKYPVPMTISVIEAELSPQGLYPNLSAEAEKIAQEIFKQPNVAIASHSYSHPFIWRQAAASDVNEGYNLRLPGYRFDLQREITGSINYINERLAPPGKKVEMFLWTGDCVPGSDALTLTQAAGVLNMNGGDTMATRSQPTGTLVDGLGVPRAGGFQVFAPNQNENVYTNNWMGPFYGYQRVIETFEFTEKPRRLKPIDIYFHTYLTTKAAGMRSLDKVFAWALAQEVTPVHASDYARKVLDFQRLAIARSPNGWRIRGTSNLRTLRVPTGTSHPDLAASRGVAGFNDSAAQTYVHLSADDAELVLNDTPDNRPRLVSANARIARYVASATTPRWDLAGYVPLAFTLANVQTCQVRVDGRTLKPTAHRGNLSEFQIKDHVAGSLEALCKP